MDTFIGKVVDFGVQKLKSINDFDENLETLERNVKQLSYKAFDVKTNIENREQSGKKRRKREVGSWFVEVKKIKKELRALKQEVRRGKKNGGPLEKMNERVGVLLEQSRHFGMPVHDMYESEVCLLLAPQLHEETSKQNLENILTWLQDDNVSSIGIYGMGGVGKTTLAKHIHNRLLEETHYRVHWVTVSQGFSIKRLQDDLSKVVNLDLSNEVDEHRRAAKLNRAFKERKNIVIILDDVWDRLCLEKLGDPLGVEGCRLILTTRSYEVCQKMGCKKLFEVEKLNTEDAWELFRKSLGCEIVLCPDIEPIAKSMAGRCKGLPLGLITLAGSMRGVTDIREWKNALKEFPDDMESDVFKVLQYSYDRLRDRNLQECFLYCALYPEDYKIVREELIGRFIMEGLVKGNSRQEEFNQGHTILNKLVKVCLLEATDYTAGRFNSRHVEAVKMHDLLREMALRITNFKPRYMVRAGMVSQVPEEHDWAFDLDKVSFYNSLIKGIPEDMAPNCPTLSTLLFGGCCLRVIPESFFQHMNNLQVLDLSYNSELMDLPSCISNMESLRAILLRQCEELRSIPPLGKLKNLRVLDVSGIGIKEVPQGMESLVKLKFLDMGRVYVDELPGEILPKLSHLQYLNLPLCVNARGEDLASLELLEEFKGRFCDLLNFNKFMRNHHEKDWRYDIIVREQMYYYGYDNFEDNSDKHSRVIVEDCTIEAGGGEAPTSIILPHCIQILEIKNCHGLCSCLVDNFLSGTTLRGLTCRISHCDDIEWIVKVPSGRNTTTDPHCMCFHSLNLSYLPNFFGLCKGKIASHTFSGLTELHIEWCPRLKKLFPRAILEDLKNLESLFVRSCEEMEEIIAEETTDKEGSSQSSNSQQHLITSTSSDLPKLKQLGLFYLPKLKRICKEKIASHTFSGLTELHIESCHRLKKLFPRAILEDLKNLESIEVGWCEEMEEIIAEEATEEEGSSQSSKPQQHQITSTSSHLPKLKQLELKFLPKLKRICEGKIASHTFSGLTELEIKGCPRLKKLFPWAILEDLKNLESISVNSCEEMEEIIAEEATEEEGSSQSSNPQQYLITSTSSHLPKLKVLHLKNLPKLKRICEGKIASHTFSGLTELRINGCPRLKKLFPRAILEDLKNLERLHVSGCEEMEEIIGEEAAEEEGSSQSSNPQQHLFTSTSSDLPKLKGLKLSRLPKLKRICEGKLICDSLVWMCFLECPNLKRLPFYSPTTNGNPFTSLREIEVEENWWKTLEWDQSHIKTLFQRYITLFEQSEKQDC